MKTQRRHELQHNTLDATLGSIVDFFRRRGNYIAWGALVVALIVFVAVFAWNRRTQKAAELQMQFSRAMGNEISNPDERLKKIIELAQSDNKDIAAKASIAAGNEYFQRVLVGTAPKQRQDDAKKAADFYNRVIANFAEQRPQVAMAYFGLGRLAENDKQFDKAKEHYAKATAVAGDNTPIAAQARMATDELKDLQEPVAMATTAPAEPTTSTAPATDTTPATGAAPAAATATTEAATAATAPAKP